MGFIQDKCGHRASLSFIIANSTISVFLLIYQNEAQHFNFWLASVTMFGLGVIDNCAQIYLNIVLGFEFESKIVPFGTKNFIECITLSASQGCLMVWTLKTKAQYN